ncbi:hypothetical protein [Bradyrhizobium sp. DASA03120]|uniref:hypothetical protein n=1 Tax=Bradyrhizobium sp. SMVTL-02 TaxID=3395917 RepID=UPI003F721667
MRATLSVMALPAALASTVPVLAAVEGSPAWKGVRRADQHAGPADHGLLERH